MEGPAKDRAQEGENMKALTEGKYCITARVLEEIAKYAVEHPEKHFCADELSDETGDFLSCFFIEDDKDGYPIWELDECSPVAPAERK